MILTRTARHWRALAVVVAMAASVLVVAAGAATSGPADRAAARAQRAAERLVTHTLARPARAATYWTPERMAAAKPLLAPAPQPDSADGPRYARVGAEESHAGGLGLASAQALAQQLYPDAWEDDGADGDKLTIQSFGADQPATAAAATYMPTNRVYPYPPPYVRYTANKFTQMWKEYPWRTIGRLFFTVPGQGNASCTASVAIGRVVWTAGHCVFTPGVGWHTNVTFVPAYRNGKTPFGTFVGQQMVALNGWVNSANNAYDIAAVALKPRKGIEVANWVGWLGVTFNASVRQFWHSNGYPGNITNSRFLIVCEGSQSSRWALPGPDPVGMGCDMTFGSSGGPWLRRPTPYVAGAVNQVNSVVSFGDPVNFPQEFFGPYFGTGAKNIYKWAKQQ